MQPEKLSWLEARLHVFETFESFELRISELENQALKESQSRNDINHRMMEIANQNLQPRIQDLEAYKTQEAIRKAKKEGETKMRRRLGIIFWATVPLAIVEIAKWLLHIH